MLTRATLPQINCARRTSLKTLVSRPSADSLLCVVAHPADEIISAGGSFKEWAGARFVHLTDGAPRDLDIALDAGFECRDEYARARSHEFAEALHCAGLDSEQVTILGFGEGELSFHLASLTMSLASLFYESGADILVTHPYEGIDPDHDATAFAVQSAVALLERDGLSAPARIEMADHHEEDEQLVIGKFLTSAETESVTVRLEPASQQLKRAMFDQIETQQGLLDGAEIHSESFRIAPRHDFTKPPIEGILAYERRGAAINGRRWRKLAAEALRVLGLAHD